MHTINRWTFQSSFSAQHARTNTSTQKANNQENAPKLFQSKHKWSHTNQKDQSVYDLLCLMNYYCFNSVFVRWSTLCTLFPFLGHLPACLPWVPCVVPVAQWDQRQRLEVKLGALSEILHMCPLAVPLSHALSVSHSFYLGALWGLQEMPIRNERKLHLRDILLECKGLIKKTNKKTVEKRPTCMRKKTLLNKMLLLNVYQRVTSEFDSES